MTERSAPGGVLRSPDSRAVAFLVLFSLLVFSRFLLDGVGFLYWDALLRYSAPQQYAFSHLTQGGGFWCPSLGLGHPLLAAGETPLFYPPAALAFLLLGFHGGGALLLPFHFSLASILTYFLARRLSLSRPASVLAGLAFAYSGWMLGHMHHPMFQWAAAWTPGLFLGLHGALTGARGRFPALLSVSIAATLLAGSPPVAQVAAFSAAGVTLFLLLFDRRCRPRHRRLLTVAAATGLGVGLSAVALLPTLLHLGDSLRGAGLSVPQVLAISYPPTQLVTLVSPFALGWPEPGMPADPLRYFGAPIFSELSAYVGFITLFLVPCALFLGRRRRAAGRLLTGFAVVLLIALGSHTPAGPVLARLPGFSGFRVLPRFLLSGTLALSLLGAMGLDALCGSPGPRRRRASTILLVLSGLAALGAVAAHLLEPTLVEWGRGFLRDHVIGQPGREASPEHYLALPGALLGTLRDAAWQPAILALAAGLLLRLTRGPRLARALALLVALDLSFGYFVYARPRPAPERSPLAAVLHSAGIRAIYTPKRIQVDDLRGHRGIQANCHPQYGIATPQVRSWLALRGIQEMLQGVEVETEEGGSRRIGEGGIRVLRLLGVEAILHDLREGALSAFGTTTFGVFDGFEVLRIPDPRPRAWCVENVNPVPRERMVASLLDPDVVAGRAALVAPGTRDLPVKGDADAVVGLIREDPTRLVLEVHAARPSLLVVGGAYAKGWRATVNGAGEPVIPVNLALRGVVVPEGRSEVVMSYSPPGVPTGAAVSLVSLVVLILLGAASRRRPVSRSGGP